LLNNLLF